jgi:hypothetical protein
MVGQQLHGFVFVFRCHEKIHVVINLRDELGVIDRISAV